MRLLLSLILLVIIISCGSGGGQTPSSAITPPMESIPVPKLSPTYIIAGQSNAVGLLNIVHGQGWQAYNGYLYTPQGTIPGGEAIDGSSIDFWLTSSNSMPVLSQVLTYCTTNTYFIWWQGESDTTDPRTAVFKDKTIKFLSQVQSYCPIIKIIVVTINSTNLIDEPNLVAVQNIQDSLSYNHFSIERYPLQDDGIHIQSFSYLQVWLDITKQYN